MLLSLPVSSLFCVMRKRNLTMRSVEWQAGKVRMIDQRQLPWALVYVEYADHRQVAQAIVDMVVRGAPAIGAAATFAVVLAAQECMALPIAEQKAFVRAAAQHIRNARPTAVNLMWAVDRMVALLDADTDGHRLVDRLLAEAQNLADQDVATNQAMAKHGITVLSAGDVVLHHCNTGALATVDYGTALGVIRHAHQSGLGIRALLTETRPRMQGARLSAWELDQLGVPFHIIPDSAAGHYMQRGEIKAVLVGADRVAANGDTANKIGTYMLAVLAKENGIPFYVVAPTSTIDLNTPDGEAITIEDRGPEELRTPYGHPLVPAHFPARNPAFDVTPHRYISGIITQHGIVREPFGQTLAAMVGLSLRV
jgi:methylthioribose-1-phosphate isomerase